MADRTNFNFKIEISSDLVKQIREALESLHDLARILKEPATVARYDVLRDNFDLAIEYKEWVVKINNFHTGGNDEDEFEVTAINISAAHMAASGMLRDKINYGGDYKIVSIGGVEFGNPERAQEIDSAGPKSLQVACPRCDASVGERCETENGNEMITAHVPRRIAAGKR